MIANLQIEKEKFKYSIWKWRNHQYLYLSKELHKQASEFSSRLEYGGSGAKFNSHDSGSHFKKSTFQNGYWNKNHNPSSVKIIQLVKCSTITGATMIMFY